MYVRERVRAGVRALEIDCVFVCACMRTRERVCVRVCLREREKMVSVCVFVRAYLRVFLFEGVFVYLLISSRTPTLGQKLYIEFI